MKASTVGIHRSKTRGVDHMYFCDWVEADVVLRRAGVKMFRVEGYFHKHQIPRVCAILRLNGYEVEVYE